MQEPHLSPFGEVNGESVLKFRLKNNLGMIVELTNYGATLVSCYVPDREGIFENVVLGFKSFDDYVKDDCYIGSTIGRVAGRIRDGKFLLDGVINRLLCNDVKNNCHLHGGSNSINKKVWKWRFIDDSSVSFFYTSPVGDNGYPGTLHITTTYTLSSNDYFLSISMSAISDAETPVNLTNHSYYNLEGLSENYNGDCLNHEISINSINYLKCNDDLLPTGDFCYLSSNKESIMDFRFPKTIKSSIDILQNTPIKGYDHFYCLNADKKAFPSATAYSQKTGRRMKVFTNQHGILFYTGNFLAHDSKLINNIALKPYLGFCFEAQGYPNAVNEQMFPSQILLPSAVYSKYINLAFSVD